jgi:hypothetical protein
MNKKFNLLVMLVSLLALGLVFGSCDNGTTNGTGGGGGGGGDDITYTVNVDGDDNNTSTRMDFEFSDAVLSLSSTNIQIGSPAKVYLTQLESTDSKHWSFSLDVWHGGNTTVKINQSGIESGTKNVFIRYPGLEDVDDGIMSGECEEIIEVTVVNKNPWLFKIMPQFPGVKNSLLCTHYTLLEHEIIETDFENWNDQFFLQYMNVNEGFVFAFEFPYDENQNLVYTIRIKYTWQKGTNY